MNNTPTGLIAAKRLAVAVAAVCATLAAPAFANDDAKNLLDLMLKKGVISQQDYDQFMKDNADAAENKQFKEKRVDSDIAKANAYILKNAETGQVMKNGLGIQSADGQYSVALTGRVHMDYRNFGLNDGATEQSADGFSLRRARFGVKGNMTKDFDYFVFGEFGQTATTLDEAYVTYVGTKETQVRIGKFKMPFSLEQMTSSNNIDFMERSLIGNDDKELIPGKQFGAMLFGSPISGASYALALSQGTAATSDTANYDKNDFIGRLAGNIAEINGNKDMVTHVGLGYSSGRVGAASAAFSSSTEGKGVSTFIATNSTAAAANAERTRKNVELAFASGPFKLQGESFDFDYENAGSELGIKGYYAAAVWNITGEQHNYSNSSNTFGWIKPNQSFSTSKGGLGAWQVGLRLSKIESTAAATTTTTNEADAMTLGLTWFANTNVRFMLNYVKTNFGSVVKTATTGPTEETALNLRAQVSF